MRFPDKVTVDQWKREWSDRYVRVKPGVRADLTRFEGRVGRVVTVNYSGRAVVDFGDQAWYDISDFQLVLDEVTDDAEKKTYKADANSAQAIPARQA